VPLNRTKLPGYEHFQHFPDIDAGDPLIGPGDAPPYMTYNDHGSAPVVLVADHASPYFPAGMNQLGLADWVLEQHVSWDIGSDQLARHLADELDAQLVLAGFSRLIVDPNRQPDDPSAFPEISDGIAIPGNIGIGAREKALRIRCFFKPYHDAITDRINAFLARGIAPAVIAVHTCTPVFDRVVRPWHIGIMWDKDPRIPQPLIEYFRQREDICIGDNEPYSGSHPHDFTIDYHAEPGGLPHVGIEVRQDLVADDSGARQWAETLAQGLRGILADAELYQPLEGAVLS
jgi:predicted N-formylglutamate amidohydrolase